MYKLSALRRYLLSISNFIFILIFTVTTKTYSQDVDNRAVYLRFPTIPKFSVVKCPDNSVFTRDDLKKIQTLIIYFSPTCEHCKSATAQLLAHKKELKKMQVLMISTLPMAEISKFYYEMHLQDEPEIIVSMDPKYFFPVFYQVQQLPALFVYDKKGQLSAHPENMLEALKKIKL